MFSQKARLLFLGFVCLSRRAGETEKAIDPINPVILSNIKITIKPTYKLLCRFIKSQHDFIITTGKNRNNYIISHRYSILVKQYVQTSEAHQFYKSLKELSSSESLFSQTQPGFLVGNVFSESDSSEKVLGFFEVSSVSSKRVYFNYKDLFPGEILPPYYINCTYFFSPALITRDMLTGIITESPLQDAIKRGEQFLEENLLDGELVIGAPYEMVLPPCGDCTVLGSNVVPDFWVE